MKRFDYAKAFLGGAVVLALNILTLVILVFGYAHLVEPDQTPEFYSRAAPDIGRYSGPIGGTIIMFLLVWALSRRKPSRNAHVFAGVVFISYLVLDLAMGLAAAPAAELFRVPFFLGMVSTGAAAFAAAHVSGRIRNLPATTNLGDMP